MFSLSRFGQLLQLLPKAVFHQQVKSSGGDRYAKSLKSWDMLMVMLYGQLKQVDSLRTLVTGFNTQTHHHYHLNTQSVRRSTLSDALAKRSDEPFKVLCESLLKQMSRQQRKQGNRMLSAIDSTVITLRGGRYDDWSLAHKTCITQGLKIHVAMDIEQAAPTYANITYANVNDMTDAQGMPIQAGMTYVMDKGYCDYNWWYQLNTQGAKFVTRLKYNANFKIIRDHCQGAETHRNIVSDEVVHLCSKTLSKGRKNAYANKDLRRICVHRNAKRPLVIICNDFERSAEEIADIYRQRWQIELLFKWLKQKLKLKTSFGNSENAVRIQLYCALIAYLLMILLKQSQVGSESLSQLLIELRHSLFHRPGRDRYYYHRRKQRREEIRKWQRPLWT